MPNLLRSRMAANQASLASVERNRRTKVLAEDMDGARVRAQKAGMVYSSSLAPPPPPDAASDRKMVRTSSMDLIVKSPSAAVEKIRQLAEQIGGFLVTSELHGEQDTSSGSIIVRVPSSRFEEACAEIRKLGLRVESEKVEAQDVTKQY